MCSYYFVKKGFEVARYGAPNLGLLFLILAALTVALCLALFLSALSMPPFEGRFWIV